MTNEQEQGREAEIRERANRPIYSWQSGSVRSVHRMLKETLAQLDSARVREAALRSALASLAARMPPMTTERQHIAYDRACKLLRDTDLELQALLSAAAAPAEAGHEEGGVEG